MRAIRTGAGIITIGTHSNPHQTVNSCPVAKNSADVVLFSNPAPTTTLFHWIWHALSPFFSKALIL